MSLYSDLMRSAGKTVIEQGINEVRDAGDRFEPKYQHQWYPRRRGLFWIVEQRLWSDAFGTAFRWHKYRNGMLRRFWTRKQAAERANLLNGFT